MLFQSPTFLIFFALFLSGLGIFKDKNRTRYVTAASYLFYGWWYPPYVAVLFGLTLYAYVFARLQPVSKPVFGAVIALGLAPLAVFKYSGFVFGLATDWTLPLGISFITFTAIAFVFDARAGKVEKTVSFWDTALFISFFPQLIAGPILRARELMPQLSAIRLNLSTWKQALLLFSIGIAKKVGVADQIAPVVDGVFNNAADANRWDVILATYGFAVQIYCDFSGYTDMALGLALFLNIALPLNFDRPYGATSIRDFWRRWHMTLSRWLRDYLYVALGGNRHGVARLALAVMMTMLLGGFWHGAAWTFILWGGLHGSVMVLERLSDGGGASRRILPDWFKRLYVFHLVALGWIVFRAPDFQAMGDMFAGLTVAGDLSLLVANPIVIVLTVLVLALHAFDSFDHVKRLSEKAPAAVIFTFCICLITICVALSSGNPSAFIYFDF